MNWFERYAIPGLCFVGLMAGWVYALHPEIICQLHGDSLLGVTALLVAMSLPIGYIISILGQTLYLKVCFLGLHRKALGEEKPPKAIVDAGGEVTVRAKCRKDPDGEAHIEAMALLLTAFNTTASDKSISAETHTYVRNWIAKRMDVIAINTGIFLATPLAFLFAVSGLCISSVTLRWSGAWMWFVAATSVVVMLVTGWSMCVLRRQVKEAIAGVFRRYMPR